MREHNTNSSRHEYQRGSINSSQSYRKLRKLRSIVSFAIVFPVREAGSQQDRDRISQVWLGSTRHRRSSKMQSRSYPPVRPCVTKVRITFFLPGRKNIGMTESLDTRSEGEGERRGGGPSTSAPYKLILSVSIHTRSQWHSSHLKD